MRAGGFAPVPALLAALRAGGMVALADDAERENEGDIIAAANGVCAATINFMATHGRGLICLALTPAHCDRLRLPQMTRNNRAAFGTNFTVSIEAARGVSTGISAADRATTICAAANPRARPQSVVSPGHVFPLRAAVGGVLARPGHTEAGCDLAAMAGLFPAAVICEIMNKKGDMARLPQLRAFARRHKMPLGRVRDVAAYRLQNETLAKRVGASGRRAGFAAAFFNDTVYGERHCVLHIGDLAGKNRQTHVAALQKPLAAALQDMRLRPPPALRRIAAAKGGALALVAPGKVVGASARAQRLRLQNAIGEHMLSVIKKETPC